MLFDTLELSKALQPSFTPEQAEVLVQALGKASTDQLATKSDLAELKMATNANIAELKGDIAELKGDIAELKGNITSLRSDLTSLITAQISLLRAETIKWIVSALAFNFVATAGLIITLTKVFGK